eukprot:XP_011670282.1 PREDICTED: IQ motif and SEC7 domain-containing protein 3 [Strongylocentrotus purpuratus]
MILQDDTQESDQQLATDPSDLLKDSNSNTPKTAESTPAKDTATSTPFTPTPSTPPATPTPQTPSTTPRGGKPSPPPKPNTTPKTPRRTPPPRQDSLHTSPTPEVAVKGSPRPIPRRKPKPDSRTIAIQTDNSHTPSASTTDSPQPHGSPGRVFPTQASITIPEQAVLRQSTPHSRVSRAVSIAVDSPTTHLAGTSQEKPTKIRWDLSPSPRNRASLRREKSIKQRREEERLIKQSRVLGSSYELSPDLQQKQVEMLEKRYGGRTKAQKAANVIQQAYRKHELQKEFQRLRRTRSDSRISSYLKNYSAKVHSKHSNRARVMVIEDTDTSTPVMRDTRGAMRKLEKKIEEGAELAGITRELESQAKQTINESSISPVVRSSTPTEQHRNNSNNVFPKGVVTPKDKGNSGDVEEMKEGSGKKVVVTLTMTRHNASTEIQERSQASRSEKTIITQKDVVRVQSQEVWKTSPKGGSVSPPPPISPGSSPPSSGRAVTKIITTSEKQVARKVCIPDMPGSPQVVQNSSPGVGVLSPVVVRASEMPTSTHCGFVLTGMKDVSMGNGSESPTLSRPVKTVSVGNDVMSPVIDRRVVKKESPRVQSSPIGVVHREGRKSLDQTSTTKQVEASQDTSYSRHLTRTDSNVVAQEVADRKCVGNEHSIETNSLRASHTPAGSMRQEGSTDKKRESVSSSGSTGTEGDVNMEYISGGRRMASIRADDSISTTSTVSGESFEVISIEQSSSSDVPSVVVATPEGSLMDFVHSSTDSEGSDTEGDLRSRSHSGSVDKNKNVAITAKRRMAKANSTGQMNSPVWKRKNQDTRIGTRNGTLMNGSATPVRMTRSDTGDSMSSESSGSSKYTFPDDSSISESNDTLPGEIEELCGKRPLVPSLSIPMTPSRRRRYRVGINLFNKKPEKGIKFLIENRFIENSPHEVAKFLLKRTGFSKQKIGEYLGNLQKDFNQLVLECFVEAMGFTGLTIDEALRKFQMSFLLPGEAQKIERLMEAFSKRYCYCNAEFANSFHNVDTIFILSFAITKLYKKKTGAILGYKKKVLLQGATVLEFSSQHYPYGIRLVSRQDKTLASFCASHPEDRTKFVADIRECILEIEEMESLRDRS